MVLHEVGTEHPDRTYYADATETGQIANNQFVTDISHLGVRFYLTARGAASQAQLTFTDGNVVVRAQVANTSTFIGVTFPVNSVRLFTNGTCNGTSTQSNTVAFTTLTNGQGTNSTIGAGSKPVPQV